MKLVIGDCLEVMSAMSEDAVDFIFADPPYNQGKDYGKYKDNLPLEEYRDWIEVVVHECRRVSRYGVAFFISSELTKMYWDAIPDARQIIVHKRAHGICKHNMYQQYFSILTTRDPTERCHNLWNDIRLPGEGYLFREERQPNPGFTSEALTNKVIKHFTTSREKVLDPFMGTGTTALACVKYDCNFIGIDLNEEYIDVAKERLEKTHNKVGEISVEQP